MSVSHRRILVASEFVLAAACGSQPPAATSPGGQAPTYVRGFFDPERGDNGEPFRWMQPEGVIRFENPKRFTFLTLKGSYPRARITRVPKIRVELNGQLLEDITPQSDTIERVYELPAARLGTEAFCELKISSSESFIPRELDPASMDQRRLAFLLHYLSWDPNSLK